MKAFSFPSKITSSARMAAKAFRMQWSGSSPAGGGYSSGAVLPIDDTITIAQSIRRFMSDIDYAKEIGDVTSSSLVMTAVSWVGRTLPEAVVRIVEPNEKGKEEAVPNHPFITKLRRPNPHYSGATLWKASALSWILSGNIYWWIRRNVRDGIAEIYWWPHWMIRPIRASRNDFTSYYEINVDGIWTRLSKQDSKNVVHFMDGIDPHDDKVGLSPLAALIREVYADNKTADYRAAIMRNGGAIPYALAPKDPGVDINVEKLKAEALRKTTGEDVGKPLILSAGIELLRLAISPKDMLVDEFAKIPEERVAAVIGIPGMVLGYGSAWARSTFSNYEQAAEAAYETYMVPLWKYLADELTVQILLRDYEDIESLRRVDYDLSTVRALQEDEDAKHKRVGMDYQNGFITRAEARTETGFEIDPERDNVFVIRSGTTIVPADAETVEMEHEARRAGLEMQVERQRLALEAPAEESKPEADKAEEAPREKPKAQAAGAKGLPAEYAVKEFGWHKFSTLQINLPEEIAEKMRAFGTSIPDLDLDWKGREGESHITVKYGLHTQNAEDVREALSYYPVGREPFELTFGKTDYFTNGEFDVVYVPIQSRALKRLNNILSLNLENTTTHSSYVPHATIAYVKPGQGHLYAGADFLVDTSIEVDHLVFRSANGAQTLIRLDQQQTLIQMIAPAAPIYNGTEAVAG